MYESGCCLIIIKIKVCVVIQTIIGTREWKGGAENKTGVIIKLLDCVNVEVIAASQSKLNINNQIDQQK